MNEFVEAYIEFLHNFKDLERPILPKFNVSAYTESEYVTAVNNIMQDYEYIDDLGVTEYFLKGD